ncbi:unnamed protein product [Symbiodinium natans]|uniref:Uncharacterized protein n=1 Tax=Symbiodinium natans TaxID=878477 RepID=A0A812PBK5_9DINO|nr:unnamed protein product [Symbiodinium natans]
MPPKTRTVGQVARLSQSELYSLAAELKVTWPKHALDLEIRAMVARALVGGDGVDLQCVTGAESRKKELEDPQAMMQAAQEQFQSGALEQEILRNPMFQTRSQTSLGRHPKGSTLVDPDLVALRKTYGHQSWQRVDAAGRISVAKEVLEARKRAMTDEDVALTRTARKIAKVLVPLLDQAKNA